MSTHPNLGYTSRGRAETSGVEPGKLRKGIGRLAIPGIAAGTVAAVLAAGSVVSALKGNQLSNQDVQDPGLAATGLGAQVQRIARSKGVQPDIQIGQPGSEGSVHVIKNVGNTTYDALVSGTVVGGQPTSEHFGLGVNTVSISATDGEGHASNLLTMQEGNQGQWNISGTLTAGADHGTLTASMQNKAAGVLTQMGGGEFQTAGAAAGSTLATPGL